MSMGIFTHEDIMTVIKVFVNFKNYSPQKKFVLKHLFMKFLQEFHELINYSHTDSHSPLEMRRFLKIETPTPGQPQPSWLKDQTPWDSN